jgi:hypothetical protein
MSSEIQDAASRYQQAHGDWGPALDVRAMSGRIQTASRYAAIAAVLIGLQVAVTKIGVGVNDGGPASLVANIGRIITIPLLLGWLFALRYAVVALFRGGQAFELHQEGLVWRRTSGQSRAIPWEEIGLIDVSYAGLISPKTHPTGHRLILDESTIVNVPLVLDGGRDAFTDRLLALAGQHGVVIDGADPADDESGSPQVQHSYQTPYGTTIPGRRRKAKLHVMAGATWLGFGVLSTLITFAVMRGHGGGGVIVVGAILAGAAQIGWGYWQLSTLPPEPPV